MAESESEHVDIPGLRLFNRLEITPRLAKPVQVAGAPLGNSDARIGVLGRLLPGAFSREGFERFLVVDSLDGDTLIVEAEISDGSSTRTLLRCDAESVQLDGDVSSGRDTSTASSSS